MAALWKTTAVLTWLLAADSVNCLPQPVGTTVEHIVEQSATHPETAFKTQYPPSNQRIAIPAAEPVCQSNKPTGVSKDSTITLILISLVRLIELPSTTAVTRRSFLFQLSTLVAFWAALVGCCCPLLPPYQGHFSPPTLQTTTPQIRHPLLQVGSNAMTNVPVLCPNSH